MNEENIKRIIDLTEQGLISISEKLGVALPHLWEVLLRQQYVTALQSLFFAPLLYLAYKYWQSEKDKKGDFSDLFSPSTKSTALFLVILGISLFAWSDALGRIINPEYYVIQDIVNFIKPNVNSN